LVTCSTVKRARRRQQRTSLADGILIRRFRQEELSAALVIQSECYPPFLQEHEKAFASPLEVAQPYCLAALSGKTLVAYLLAHGWPRQSPPAIGAVLTGDAASEVLFIHDLAVASAGRRRDLGRCLVDHALALAREDGLGMAELIAIEGAADYWRNLGFHTTSPPPALAAKVAAYGAGALWMSRAIP
jgi:ribosomal protein S18 acetylase RimI-like enzyme